MFCFIPFCFALTSWFLLKKTTWSAAIWPGFFISLRSFTAHLREAHFPQPVGPEIPASSLMGSRARYIKTKKAGLKVGKKPAFQTLTVYRLVASPCRHACRMDVYKFQITLNYWFLVVWCCPGRSLKAL